MKEYLEVGCIINKRGLHGEVKVDCYCDSLDVLCSLSELFWDENGQEPVRLLAAKPYRGYVYATLSGIDSAESADRVRGKSLYAHRDSVPLEEGKNFLVDLLGLPVYNEETGKLYGTLSEVFNRGASDIYTVTRDGKDYYMPAVPEFVKRVDPEKGIFVRVIPGMLEDEEENAHRYSVGISRNGKARAFRKHDRKSL